MSGRDRPPERGDGDGGRVPMRKIDDATYGSPPAGRFDRRLVRLKRWFQLDANRWAVTALLSAGVLLTIVLVGTFGPAPTRSFLTAGASPGSILVELLKTIVSVVVIVLSINQLVLSPGLGPVGEQRDRFEEAIDLLDRIAEHTDAQEVPTSPARVLRILVDSLVEQAERLRELAEGSDDPAFAAEADEYAAAVVSEAESVRSLLRDSRFGHFDVVSAALRFAISEKVRALRGMEKRHAGSFSAAEAEALEEMGDRLRLFTVGREYLKTVYIRSEYIELSEGLLYTGLPSIVVTYCAAQLYTPTLFRGEALGIDALLLFVAGAVTVSLFPLVLLVAYVFRLAAMSRSTLFVGPFAARASDEPEP